MFRWYQEAEKCYAFLEDIQDVEQLANARWFTRGWTLQELIAPKSLVFYVEDDNAAWRKIGTREKLASEIKEIAGVDKTFLRGASSMSGIRGASFAKRVAWAAKRTTTRDEDIAYCLLGLLDVNMPLLYGEGGIKAFRRLQEEYLKVNPDHSFLAWHLYPVDGGPSISEDTFLAGHPKDFRYCNEILLASDEVAPFSLTNNNKGLTIRLPLFEHRRVSMDARRRSDYFAVLACIGNDPGYRLIIHLRAVDKSAQTFVFLPSDHQRVISAGILGTAHLTDCFILRNPKPLTPRVLKVNNLFASMISWKAKIIYFDTSTSTWICLGTPGDMDSQLIQVPDQPEGASYGVLLHPPPPSFVDTSSESESTPCLKVLIRVDIGFESRYNVDVHIQLFYDVRNEISTDLDSIPQRPASGTWSNSCSQIVSMPTEESEAITTSASWERRLTHDELLLHVNSVVVDDEYRVRELYARWETCIRLLFPTDLYVHLVYGTIFIWGQSMTKRLDTHLVYIAAGVFFFVFKIAQRTRELTPRYWDYRIPLILGMLLSSGVYFDDYNKEVSARHKVAVHFAAACMLTIWAVRDLAELAGYIPREWAPSVGEVRRGKTFVSSIKKYQ